MVAMESEKGPTLYPKGTPRIAAYASQSGNTSWQQVLATPRGMLAAMSIAADYSSAPVLIHYMSPWRPASRGGVVLCQSADFNTPATDDC